MCYLYMTINSRAIFLVCFPSITRNIEKWLVVYMVSKILTCRRPMPSKALTAVLILGGRGALLHIYQNTAIRRTVLSA